MQKLNDVFYRLTKIAEQYISHFKQPTSSDKDLTLLNYYKEANIRNIYASKIRKIHTATTSPSFALDYLFEQQKMVEIEQLGNRNIDPNLQAVHHHLDKKYLYEKLKLTCVANNYTNINNHVYDLGLLTTFFDALKTTIKKEDGILFLFYHCALFQGNDSEVDFLPVLAYLQTESLAQGEDISMVFGMCINFCIRKINTGDKAYFEVLLQLYKLQIQSGCIYNNEGYISPYSMKNILTTAIRENDFEWAEKFVVSHFEKLPPLNRIENYNYFLSRIYFEKKEFKKCIQLLYQTEAIDFLNNLSIRVLQAKALYELDDYEGLDNLLHSFRLYLLRHKNKGYHYTFHVNFIKIVKKIISMPASSKKAKEAIIETITKMDKVAEKAWLLGILTH